MKRTPEEIMERMDALLDEYEAANDRFDRNEWSKKFGEKLGSYSDKLKALNGDDFDIIKESYDEYHKDFSDISDDDYCNALEENIKKVLQRIWPELPKEEVEEAASKVAEEAEEVETTEEPVSDTPASDSSLKDSLFKPRGDKATKSTNKWEGSPHTSGGRTGRTSDEEVKEPPADESKTFQDELDSYMKSHRS